MNLVPGRIVDDLRWVDDLGLAEQAVDELRAVAERYNEPHRRYHTMAHLSEVLEVALGRDSRALTAASDEDRAAVVLAALFHDAVYDPSSSTNEPDSAALAATVLTGLGADAELVAEVVRLVELTREHLCPAGDRAAAALLDADLAVLARDDAGYDGYAAKVREEYRSYDDEAYAAGRAAVLQRLLARTSIYAGADSERADSLARANLRRELTALAAPLP